MKEPEKLRLQIGSLIWQNLAPNPKKHSHSRLCETTRSGPTRTATKNKMRCMQGCTQKLQAKIHINCRKIGKVEDSKNDHIIEFWTTIKNLESIRRDQLVRELKWDKNNRSNRVVEEKRAGAKHDTLQRSKDDQQGKSRHVKIMENSVLGAWLPGTEISLTLKLPTPRSKNWKRNPDGLYEVFARCSPIVKVNNFTSIIK